ncbi:hypothetical protein [Dysosmobacter sp.]|uniref:hypothetical protein n=1 Tax=Dysosmobacter sp. TaxID=2591382 RepID=UPI003A8E5853
MSKQKTPKREKLYARKQWVARRFVIFLIALLAVNHLMQLGFLLPIQAIRQGEERQGAPHGAVLDRLWTPEIHRTHLVYLTACEEAVTIADTYLTVYGWMGGFGWSLDCTTGEPLYAGEMTMYRDEQAGTVCCYYGRVDDPAIETVTVSVRGQIYDETTQTAHWEEAATLTAGPEDFLEREGHRHFLLSHTITDWPYDSSRHAWVIGYDAGGNVVTEFEIEQGTHSYFG